jgi:hypothetical protein
VEAGAPRCAALAVPRQRVAVPEYVFNLANRFGETRIVSLGGYAALNLAIEGSP